MNSREHLFLASGVAIVAALILGNFHVMSGSDYRGAKMLPKASFGYAETFVNTDEIIGVPMFVAMAQHPLGVKALVRAGYLESPEQVQRRVQEEFKNEMDKAMAKSQEDFRRLMEQAGQRVPAGTQ